MMEHIKFWSKNTLYSIYFYIFLSLSRIESNEKRLEAFQLNLTAVLHNLINDILI